MGSLGSIIARQLADQLGYTLVWRDLINQAAIKAGAPEVALAWLDELNLLGLSPSEDALHAYIAALRTVMLDLASQGNTIIVGRAGQIVLAQHPNVLYVRIIAPLDLRASRIAQRQRISLAAARRQVDASDRNRRNFIKRAFSVHWEDSSLYDLTINTAKIGEDTACQVVRQALAGFDPGYPPYHSADPGAGT